MVKISENKSNINIDYAEPKDPIWKKMGNGLTKEDLSLTSFSECYQPSCWISVESKALGASPSVVLQWYKQNYNSMRHNLFFHQLTEIISMFLTLSMLLMKLNSTYSFIPTHAAQLIIINTTSSLNPVITINTSVWEMLNLLLKLPSNNSSRPKKFTLMNGGSVPAWPLSFRQGLLSP